jgi:PTH1 family peptidyl-tRNA hydrolase
MPHVDAVLVGLGNPGPKYLMTRHNVGFLFLDVLVQENHASWDSTSALAKKSKSEIAEFKVSGKNVIAIKPQTYMNLSGQALEGLYQKNPRLKESELIVFHDEVDIPFKQLRIKKGGGDAGHNGLKDIRRVLGHGDYIRFRIGVGRPTGPMELADYVLQNFSKEEQEPLIEVMSRTADTLDLVLQNKWNEAQARAK